jgi:Zn-dependent protease
MLVVPLITALTQGWAMGWASAPYDPYWAERHPRRAAWMAAAGPAANFLLALGAWALVRGGLELGYFVAPREVTWSQLVGPAAGEPGSLAAFLAQGLSVLLSINVILGAFNLVPLPPLDGSAAIALVLPEAAAGRIRALARSPQFSLFGLLFVYLVFPRVIAPIFHLLVRVVHPGVPYS